MSATVVTLHCHCVSHTHDHLITEHCILIAIKEEKQSFIHGHTITNILCSNTNSNTSNSNTVILIDKVIILIMTRVCSLLNQHVPVQIPANQMTFTVPLPVDSFMTKQQMIFCIQCICGVHCNIQVSGIIYHLNAMVGNCTVVQQPWLNQVNGHNESKLFTESVCAVLLLGWFQSTGTAITVTTVSGVRVVYVLGWGHPAAKTKAVKEQRLSRKIGLSKEDTLPTT